MIATQRLVHRHLTGTVTDQLIRGRARPENGPGTVTMLEAS